MYIILFHISIFPFLLAQRLDYNSIYYSSGGNGLLGSNCLASLDSSNPVFCPENTWIYGFYLLTYNSSFGILNIVLDCRNQSYDASSSQLVQYNNMGTYGSYSLVTSSLAICNGDYGRDFVRGFSLQIWCPANVTYSKGIINVKMRCSYANDILTDLVSVVPVAGWTGLSSCKVGSVACGYELYYKGDLSGYNQNFGSINMNYKCCKICDMVNGFMFLSASMTCGHCDMNCLSCYGISTNCTACPLGYTLTETNTCTTALSLALVTVEFHDSTWTISGWTYGGSAPVPSKQTCSPYYLIGGYNVFSQNTWFTKTVSSLINHDMLKIRVKFYFVGTTSWDIACGFIYVDNVLQLTMNMTYTATRMFFATTDCGGRLLYIQQVDINVSHTASTASINFTTNLTISTGYWGVSHFMLQTNILCDSSCLSCTGTAANQCSSCSSVNFLTSSYICASSCSSPYYADSTTNTCTTTCPSPYYGDPTTNLCESSCPDNYYASDSDRICYTQCPSIYYGNPLTGLCVSTCPNGMYGDANNLCSFCDFNCATCSVKSSNCGSCTYTWLGITPSCSNPSYISNIENTIFNHNTLTTTDFINSGWTISNAYSGNTVYTCGTYIMAGGYSIAGSSAALSKSYSGLSQHLNVRITFFAMKIGNWNSNLLVVVVDSITFPALTFQTTDDTTAYKPCGSTTYTEALRSVDIYFSHTADTLSVSITSDLSTDASVSSWGIFDLTITLFLCDSTCQSCIVQNDGTQCMSCTTGSTLYLQSYVGPAQCLTICPSNTYKYTSNNTCLICDSTCATCSAGTASDCKSCLANTYLLLPPGPSICSSVCNAAYYKDDAPWQCLNCDSTCATCSIAGNSGCLTCKSGTYLQSSPGPSSCLSTCPDGSYTHVNSRQCLNCDTTCATCSIDGSANCLTCKTSTYLQLSSGPSSCLSTCPDGRYKDAILKCLPCDTTCKTCLAGDANSCFSCDSPTYLQSSVGAASSCQNTCPSGTYQDDPTRQCLSCDTKCVTCSIAGPSGCLTCILATYLQVSPGPSSCLSSCPDHKYEDSSLICLNCDSSCKTCIASDANSCTSCDLPNYLQSTLSTSSSCQTTCPDGTYKDSTLKQCLPCDTTCLTCSSNGPSNCLTCKTNNYLQLLIGPSSCLTTCPNTKYPDSSNICLFCDSSCKSCLAAGPSSCSSCNSPDFLQASIGPASCLNSCPNVKYSDISSRSCLTCDNSCLTCSSGGNSACLSCQTNLYLQSIPGPSYCLSTCPTSTYKDTSSNQCINCDSSCLTCIGSSSSSCLSCKSNTYLESSPGPCVSTCPTGYQDNSSLTCLPCDSTCNTCISSGPYKCLTCPINFYYLNNAYGFGSCISDCPSYTYKNNSNMVCLLCDSSCLTCNDSTSSACLSCESPNFLFSTPPSNCLSSCGNKYFYNDTSQSCESCYRLCESCSNYGSSLCNSCVYNFYLRNYPGPSNCMSNCPSGYYKNDTIGACQPCDNSCVECLASDTAGCNICSNGYYLQKSNNKSLIGNCTKITMITPVLIYDINPLSYILIFSSNYTIIYSLYKSYTRISIDGISNSMFNYKITPINNTDNYTIDFNLNFSITNYPLITVYLNPPSNINNSYDIQLTTYTLQTKMQYYYYMDSSTKQMINSTKQTTEAFNSVVSKTFIANNIMSVTSTLIFQFMISLDTIRFLRYFQIKYPENALALFNSQMPTADIIPNINIIEDPDDGNLPEIFQKYGVSIYIFNNNGNSLIEVLCYWIFGIICLVFVKSFRQYNNKYVKAILILISFVFVWSYSVSYFLSNFMNFAFYTLLSYRFPTIKTKMGLFNFGFSFGIGILVMVIFPFVLIKIKNIRPDMLIKGNSSNKNIIVPINNTNESKKIFISESGLKYPQNDLIIPADNENKVIVENLDTPCISSHIDSPKIVKQKTKGPPILSNIKQITNFMRKNFRKSTDFQFVLREPDSANKVDYINEVTSKTFSTTNSTLTTIKENNRDANRYGALYKGFKHDKPFQSYFILIGLFKQLIYCLIITCSFDRPYHGLIATNIFFGLFLIMMIIVRPLKKRGDNIQNIFNETCGVVTMGCALYMAYMDENNIIDEGLKLKLGWGIIFANVLLMAAFLLRMMLTWFLLIYFLLKVPMKLCKKKYMKRNKLMSENATVENKDVDKGVFEKIIEMENLLR